MVVVLAGPFGKDGIRGADQTNTKPIRRTFGRGEGGEMPEREDGPTRAETDPAVDEQPVPPPAPEDEPTGFVPARVGCRTELRGWAGAHLHGAVRPRRRAAGRGRPPGRWC
jgi:hypothetical protein